MGGARISKLNTERVSGLPRRSMGTASPSDIPKLNFASCAATSGRGIKKAARLEKRSPFPELLYRSMRPWEEAKKPKVSFWLLCDGVQALDTVFPERLYGD